VRPTAPDNARLDGGNGTITVSGSQTVGTLRASAGANFTLTGGTINLQTGNFGNGLVSGTLFTGEASSTLLVNSDVVLAADGGSGTREIFFAAGRLDAAASFLTINGNVSGGISGRSQTVIASARNDTSTTSIITFGSGSSIANGTSTALNIELGARDPAANSGRIVLNSALNTYTGETRIGSGTIVVNADAPSGSAGAFGNATSAVQFGYGNTPAAGTNRLLIGTAGVTIGRTIVMNYGAGSSNTYGVVLGAEHTSGSSTFSGNITLGNQIRTTTVQVTSAAGGNVNFTGNLIDGTAGSAVPIEKIGGGTVTLSGNNNYKGGTTVSAGTLRLNATTGGGAAQTASLTVSSGGILLISQSNQVNDTAAVTLSGGTIQRGSGVSETFGALSLTTGSFLDFGTGAVGNLIFGAYTPSSLLTVQNFAEGNTLTFGNSISSFLPTGGSLTNSYFSFNNAFSYNDTTFTITAIPEPSTMVVAGSLMSLLLWPTLVARLRRRMRRIPA
jgi:autotransporter-associated beta strand protein